jgi:hypothetical protein
MPSETFSTAIFYRGYSRRPLDLLPTSPYLLRRAKAVRPPPRATGVCRSYSHRRRQALIDSLPFSLLSPLSLVFISISSLPISVRERRLRYAVSQTAAGEPTRNGTTIPNGAAFCPVSCVRSRRAGCKPLVVRAKWCRSFFASENEPTLLASQGELDSPRRTLFPSRIGHAGRWEIEELTPIIPIILSDCFLIFSYPTPHQRSA